MRDGLGTVRLHALIMMCDGSYDFVVARIYIIRGLCSRLLRRAGVSGQGAVDDRTEQRDGNLGRPSESKQ